MAWPSKNVAFGGILHPAKSSFSPETQQFLKVLMDESKLTMFQRRQINYSLRNGEPLPAPTHRASQIRNKSDSLLLGKAGRNFIQPGPSQRRSRDTIVQSGAYERERFIMNEPIRDREVEKKKLQNKMAFGKDIKTEKKNVKKSKPKVIKEDPQLSRFDQLMNEIQEREEFLKEMENLGQGDKHRVVIKQQIRARMNEIQKLKLDDEL